MQSGISEPMGFHNGRITSAAWLGQNVNTIYYIKDKQ